MLNIRENVPLAPLTTFKIGGAAKYFVVVSNEDELKEALKWAKSENLPFFVLGGGSNLLISDKGFDGLVIKIQNSKFKIPARLASKRGERGSSARGGRQNSSVFAEAGVPLAKLVVETAKAGLSGLEWAVGIPGTVGGAVANNTGAFGRDMSFIVEKAEVLDAENLEKKELSKADCLFDYRQSRFKGNSSKIILSAVLKLERGEPEEIQRIMRENIKVRPQNVGGKSAGCFFKNIPWETSGLDRKEFIRKFPRFKKFESMPRLGAGSLIDSLDLKGLSLNDAAVSEVHAAYIVNKGNASFQDVVALAGLVKEKVKNYYGIILKEEVEIIGKLSPTLIKTLNYVLCLCSTKQKR